MKKSDIADKECVIRRYLDKEISGKLHFPVIVSDDTMRLLALQFTPGGELQWLKEKGVPMHMVNLRLVAEYQENREQSL